MKDSSHLVKVANSELNPRQGCGELQLTLYTYEPTHASPWISKPREVSQLQQFKRVHSNNSKSEFLSKQSKDKEIVDFYFEGLILHELAKL